LRALDYSIGGASAKRQCWGYGTVSKKEAMDHQDILGGLMRVHILHHAVKDELYGQWMIEELKHHGYRLSPGTLYPMLHAMERKGYLTSRKERVGKTERRFYTVTDRGREALAVAQAYLKELRQEVSQER
jgi:DNA-binding PadR family transcriptional regulator